MHVAQLVAGGRIGEGAVAVQAGAAVGQMVTEQPAAAHVEIDGAVIDHHVAVVVGHGVNKKTGKAINFISKQTSL